MELPEEKTQDPRQSITPLLCSLLLPLSWKVNANRTKKSNSSFSNRGYVLMEMIGCMSPASKEVLTKKLNWLIMCCFLRTKISALDRESLQIPSAVSEGTGFTLTMTNVNKHCLLRNYTYLRSCMEDCEDCSIS